MRIATLIVCSMRPRCRRQMPLKLIRVYACKVRLHTCATHLRARVRHTGTGAWAVTANLTNGTAPRLHVNYNYVCVHRCHTLLLHTSTPCYDHCVVCTHGTVP